MEEEVWKPIENYEGLYEVSNMGRVRSLDRITSNGRRIKSRILKQSLNTDGYPLIALYKKGGCKTIRVHILVAYAFVEGYFEGAEIDHIDTNKENNIWTNLRWVTHSGNMNNELTKKCKSESSKGNGNPFYGKNHNEETRKKMSRNHADFSGSKNPRAKMVICIYKDNTKTEPMCMKELAEYLGVSVDLVKKIKNSKDIYKPKRRYKHLDGIRIIEV